jgi:hypothetical protein
MSDRRKVRGAVASEQERPIGSRGVEHEQLFRDIAQKRRPSDDVVFPCLIWVGLREGCVDHNPETSALLSQQLRSPLDCNSLSGRSNPLRCSYNEHLGKLPDEGTAQQRRFNPPMIVPAKDRTMELVSTHMDGSRAVLTLSSTQTPNSFEKSFSETLDVCRLRAR